MRTSRSVALALSLAAVLLVAAPASAAPYVGPTNYFQVVVVLDETHGFDDAALSAKPWSNGLGWLTGALAGLGGTMYGGNTQWGLVTADRSSDVGTFSPFDFDPAVDSTNIWSDLDGLIASIGDLATYSDEDTLFDGLKGLQYAAENYALDEGTAMVLILATDDGWTSWGGPGTFDALMDEVTQNHPHASVNAIIDHGFSDGAGGAALGTWKNAPYGPGHSADLGRTGAEVYVDTSPDSEWMYRFSLWDHSLASGGAEDEFREGFADVKVQELAVRPDPDADTGGDQSGGAIPEPGTFVLLGVALGVLALVRRRRA